MKIIRTERGWPGHYICAHDCKFRRNTLLEYGDVRIVVSTVGNYIFKEKTQIIGFDRYYETMAFHAKLDEIYWDADVQKEVDFESEWAIREMKDGSDQKANDMHEAVVKEISNTLTKGENNAIQSKNAKVNRQ